jgi:hypothetical protein
MLGLKNNDLKSISDFNSAWADRIALLILLGLSVDIAAVFVSDDVWRKGFTIAADSLIAVGVWGELWFAKRAREADDGRVAEANASAARAQKEAAEARERTAEIERVTAWRRISEEQHRHIVNVIRPIAESLDLIIEWQIGDPEAFTYMQQIADVFASAGVKSIRGFQNSWLDRPVFGLFVTGSKEINLSFVTDAFAEVSIYLLSANVNLSTHRPRNEAPPNLYIFVAPKPPLPFAPPKHIPIDASSSDPQNATAKKESNT